MLRKHLPTWLSACLAVFLVLVLPSCWYGALERAAVLTLQGPTNANSTEEREEHQEQDDDERDALGTRPPPPDRAPERPAPTRIAIVTTSAPLLASASVAPVPHPAQFSVRRLR